MRGYQTIVFELNNQLSKKVSHIILQAGVGSFAGSFIDAFVNIFDYTPKFIIVEPKNANCYFNSAVNKECCTVKGDLKTIMAGLACGEPNKIAYPIINNFTSCYISASDDIAKKGMQLLAKPIEGDKKINSGESGAIGIGVINEIMTNKKYASVREKLSLNNKSTILVVNTEGITDPDNYEKIIAELD
jgi:diaminopropionate ammonia-lyase